jgi:hypothetical protein
MSHAIRIQMHKPLSDIRFEKKLSYIVLAACACDMLAKD